MIGICESAEISGVTIRYTIEEEFNVDRTFSSKNILIMASVETPQRCKKSAV